LGAENDSLAAFPVPEVLPLLRELALAPGESVAAEAVRGLASHYSREAIAIGDAIAKWGSGRNLRRF
jgi:hypothetical protein